MTVWTYPRSVVRRVVDADTIDVMCDLGMDVLRRARVRPAGAEVTVVSHEVEKYGRLLGAVHLADGQSLAQVLLRHGHAKPCDGGPR